jgi:hypothetical protein
VRQSSLTPPPAEPPSPAHFAGESTTDLLPALPRQPGAPPHGASAYGVFDRTSSPPPLDGAADAASSALPRAGSSDVHRRSRSGAFAGDLGSPAYRLDGAAPAERGPRPAQTAQAPWDDWSAPQPSPGARRVDGSRPF